MNEEKIVNDGKKLIKAQIVSAILSILLGILLHFTYKWSGENLFVASFSAVNESVWEHLKILFFPMLIIAIMEYPFIKNIVNNYLEAKTIGIFTAITFIVITFFTYTGILGDDFPAVNIIIFILSILLGEFIAYKLMKRNSESNIKTKILSIFILVFLFICFIVCTYKTPRVNLFRDPISGTYGINKN